MKIKRDIAHWRKIYSLEPIINQDNIEMIVKFLNQKFSLNVRIVFDNRARGFAIYSKGTIHVPCKVKKFLVIHEYCHIYDYMIHHNTGHTETFYKALKILIREYYGDIKTYPWICEYKSLYNRYVREFEYQNE